MANILNAIMNIIMDGSFTANREKDTKNTVNQLGDPLEEYMKDAFAGTFTIDGKQRSDILNKIIVYPGNSPNPPDMIINDKEWFAVEVKKSDSAT